MELVRIRHSWPERAGFFLDRPAGAGHYIFLHFHTAVDMTFHGQQHALPPGSMIILRPDTGHSFFSRGALMHDWMHLTGNVEEVLHTVGLACDVIYHPTCNASITELTARLEAEFFAQRSYWPTHSNALLTELFILISYNLSNAQPQPVANQTADRLRELRSAMLMHPEKDWSVENMARMVNISTSRLYPLYRRMFAISPNRDLILIRIEKAKTMLEMGTSVAETAEKMGYANIFHFIRQFHQVLGVSPGQYRMHCKG